MKDYRDTSIGKKQIVACTGLALILFVVGHLAGNLFIYGGPEAFNGYAKKLAGLRPGLYLIEMGLLVIFLTHLWVTALLVHDNIRARGGRYAVNASKGERSLATRLMPYTGTLILAFVIWHLMDFTFVDHHGPLSVLGDGQSYGLYGVVVNAFLDPWHSAFYILAMGAVGLHLSHGVESFVQTFGLVPSQRMKTVKVISRGFAVVIAGGFSTIPVFVFLNGGMA